MKYFYLVLIGLCLSGCKNKDNPIELQPTPLLIEDISVVPDSVSIRGERWGIEKVQFPESKDGSQTGADTNCEERSIRYSLGFQRGPLYTKSLLRDLLWHEIFHASQCYIPDQRKANWHKYTLDSPEHEQVYDDGMFMSVFVHDNPEFMNWAENWK